MAFPTGDHYCSIVDENETRCYEHGLPYIYDEKDGLDPQILRVCKKHDHYRKSSLAKFLKRIREDEVPIWEILNS